VRLRCVGVANVLLLVASVKYAPVYTVYQVRLCLYKCWYFIDSCQLNLLFVLLKHYTQYGDECGLRAGVANLVLNVV